MSLVADTRLTGDYDDADRPGHANALPRQSWLVDFVVFAAIATTAMAAAIALQGEAGLSPMIAILSGVVSFVVLASLHLALRRMEYRSRATAVLGSATTVAKGTVDTRRPAATTPQLDPEAPSLKKTAPREPEQMRGPREPREHPMPHAPAANAAPNQRDAAPGGTPAPSQPAVAEKSNADPWSVRPGNAFGPAVAEGPALAGVPQRTSSQAWGAGPGQTPNRASGQMSGEVGAPTPSEPRAKSHADARASNAETGMAARSADQHDPMVIENVLARMARDLNAPPTLAQTSARSNGPGRPEATTLERHSPEPGVASSLPHLNAPPPLPSRGFAAAGADGADHSPSPVLHPTAAARGADPYQTRDEPREARVQDKLAAIAGALAQERIDVFLEPIAGLEGDGVAHFEVAVRLRLEDAALRGRSGYGAAAAGTPLLPLIDTLALVKSRRVAWRIFKPDEDGHVFTAVDAASLTDRQFLTDFDAMVRGDTRGAKRLVMSFGHDEARALTGAQTATLSRLAASGFAFAVDDLVDMDLDFEALRRAGFSFVKVDADVFLDGMPVGQSRIPADDICRHLKSFDLQPIVGHIADRTQLQRLRACGVALGQGPLLGGPHIVQSEWLDD